MSELPPPELIECPDCGAHLPTREAFVEHRATEHPPALRVLVPAGIETAEAHGYEET